MEDKLRALKNNPSLLTHVTFTEQNKQNVHRRLTKHKKLSFPYSVVAVMFTDYDGNWSVLFIKAY